MTHATISALFAVRRLTSTTWQEEARAGREQLQAIPTISELRGYDVVGNAIGDERAIVRATTLVWASVRECPYLVWQSTPSKSLANASRQVGSVANATDVLMLR